MSYVSIHWVACLAVLLTYLILRKKISKGKRNWFVAITVFIFFAPTFLPRQLFGHWNSISQIDSKEIKKILLVPSLPNWQVNLTGTDVTIEDNKQIDTICLLLRNAEIYFPNHPNRYWEVNMVFIDVNEDSLEIGISQSDRAATVIYTEKNKWRKDSIGKYLERITNNKAASFGDSAKERWSY